MSLARLVVLASAASTLAFSSLAHAENPRRDLYKSYDYNDDGRLKGKEAKNLKKEKPNRYDNLQAFCDDAVEHPKKHDVKFPPDVKEKKVKCKKKRIDAPYMKAWVRAGANSGPDPKPAPKPEHPQHPQH